MNYPLCNLNVLKLGSAPNHLFLLHGWGQSLQSLKPLGELLTPYFTIHLIDLPGFGKSPAPSETWGIEEYARVIRDYAKSQNIETLSLLGHSFGGKISLYLASQNDLQLDYLVLIAASGLRPYRSFRKKVQFKAIGLLAKVLKTLDKFLKTNFFKNWFTPKFASRDYQEAGILRNTFVKTVNQELSKEASLIKTKTLLLWGELDRETPFEIGLRLSKLIKGSKLITFPNKDHFPFEGAGAQLCAYHLKSFIGNLKITTATS